MIFSISHKTKKNVTDTILPEGWPTYIAHRGASSLAPENSLAAFELARKLGAKAIELDVHLCKSGELVVTHDHILDRIAGLHMKVEDLEYSELVKIDTGSFFNTKFPAQANPSFANERIPTLDMVFETAGPDMYFDVEMKVDGKFYDSLAQATALCLGRHNRGNCIVSSFHPLALRSYKKYGIEKTAAIYCSYDTVPFIMRHKECVYLSGADIKKPSFETAFKSRTFETGSKPVLVWTVDTTSVAQTLLENNVTSIITNRIQDFIH